MIINTDEIEALLNSNISGSIIGEETGLGRAYVNNYRNHHSQLKNMTLEAAGKLQQFYQSQQNERPVPKLKIAGIRKAVGAFNRWQGAARVYFDLGDMSVWTITYSGPRQWDQYHDPKIQQIAQKATVRMDERDNQLSMRKIQKLVAEAINND